MALLDFFRPAPRITDRAGVEHFLETNAAFVVQKCMVEYSRARAGMFWQVMFREPDFLSAMERGRWAGWPLGLVMIAEMLESELVDAAPDARPVVVEALREAVLTVFDRLEQGSGIPAGHWAQNRADLVLRLNHMGLHPPKKVIDLPRATIDAFFAVLPIHAEHKQYDQPVVLQQLRGILLEVHGNLARRLDRRAVLAAMLDAPEQGAA